MFALLRPTIPREHKVLLANSAASLRKQIADAYAAFSFGQRTGEQAQFEERLNGVYTAAYLAGFAHGLVPDLTENERLRANYSRRVFNALIPGRGAAFVQRHLAANLDDPNAEFKVGFLAGQLDMATWRFDDSQPIQLGQYLLTGRL